MIFLLAILGLLAIGVVYQRVGLARDRRRYPAPGRVSNGLHINSQGSGIPPVLFESGISASSVNWTAVQREIARDTTASSYDRAGFAWSNACSNPRTVDRIIHELRSVTASIEKPFIFVGHSFGGLIGRIYASRYPEDLCGMVLVDPALTSEWAEPTPQRRYMLSRGIRLSRRGAWLCNIGFVRLSLSLLSGGSRVIPKFFAKASSGKASGVLDRLVGEVRKMPPELWPSIQSHWCRAESFNSMAAHLASLPEMCREAARVTNLGSLPLIVISGAHLTEEQRAEHASIAATSPQGKHVQASQGGHWIQLDEPELVLQSIRALRKAAIGASE